MHAGFDLTHRGTLRLDASQAARVKQQTLRDLMPNPALALVAIDGHAINIVAKTRADLQCPCRQREHREGVHAFLAKRKPAF